MTADRKPMVKLTEVWERTSSKGNVYYSGFLGASQLLIFRDGERPHPSRPDETIIVWKVLLQERDQAPRQQAPNAERGQRAHDRSRDAGRARAAGEAILAAAGRDRQPEPPQGWLDDHEAAVRDLEGGR